VPLYVLMQLVVSRTTRAITLFALLLLNLIFELFEVFEILKLPMKKARHLPLLSENIGAPAEEIRYRFLLSRSHASFLINRVHFDCCRSSCERAFTCSWALILRWEVAHPLLGCFCTLRAAQRVFERDRFFHQVHLG
jgi:hypothetical protein